MNVTIPGRVETDLTTLAKFVTLTDLLATPHLS
jgi:hypothetical protein